MCGIFGFVGNAASPAGVVVDGLRRLEYRGYESWGVAATAGEPKLRIVKSVGKISRTPEEELERRRPEAFAAVGHTRWATHDPPNEINAHPHLSRDGRLAVVHNGIIENYRDIRERLVKEGFTITSDTDTETIVHLLDLNLRETGNFAEALVQTLRQLRGAFGLGVLDARQPNKLYAVRMGSPLVIGLSDERNYLSSDANALVAHTRQVIYLDDGEWAELSQGEVATYNFHRAATTKIAQELTVELASTSLGDFPHYMLKEIHDQPDAMRDVIRGRLLHCEATVHLAGLSKDSARRPRCSG